MGQHLGGSNSWKPLPCRGLKGQGEKLLPDVENIAVEVDHLMGAEP